MEAMQQMGCQCNERTVSDQILPILKALPRDTKITYGSLDQEREAIVDENPIRLVATDCSCPPAEALL